ncbi:unnamed protein product [Rhizoctonia solani]|uniref:NACHT domain-containing protein n=1 Tax=Rhizoctonia solani TaxID=456999 RepID=A0A8H3GIV9_9AGAM|nr:unnamed protein product [Rhizoctonia solani]
MPFRAKIKDFTERVEESWRRRLGRSDRLDGQSSTSLPASQTPSEYMLSPVTMTSQAALSMSNIDAIQSTPEKPAARWAFLEDLTAALSPMAAKGRQDYEALRSHLIVTLEELKSHFTGPNAPEMSPKVARLCESIQQEVNLIKTLQAEGTVRRHMRVGSEAEEVLGCYTRIHGYLSHISVGVKFWIWSIHRMVEQQSKDLEEHAKKIEEQAKRVEEQERKANELAKNIKSTHAHSLLTRLSPSFSAYYSSAKAIELKRDLCTPGTRIDVLAHMHQWASMYGPDAGSVYWLNGMAGTGKTTIAYSLCAELDKRDQLAASFFCSRLLPECRDVNRIIPSISYQLAQHLPVFGTALLRVLERDPDIHTRLPSIQFASLVSEPLLEVEASIPANLVVVIDALDECDNKESTSVVLSALLQASDAPQLPIRFFVSSRPEPEIRQEMNRRLGQSKRSQLILHELDTDTVQMDIDRYIRAELAPMNRISDIQVAQLVAESGVLFIYAATAIRYISYKNFTRDPYGRLATVLNMSGPGTVQRNKTIDELYTVILRAALEDEEINEVERNDIIQLLHTVVNAQEPLTVSAITSLLELGSDDRVRAAISPLMSVLHMTGIDELVTTLHASFADYIFDKSRSLEYHCDKAAHNDTLARQCFAYIQAATPKFNIFSLGSSYRLDRAVPELDRKLKSGVSAHMSYVFRYWATHVVAANVSKDLGLLVGAFLSTRLLLWLEVMNLTRNTQMAVDAMRRVDHWVTLVPS